MNKKSFDTTKSTWFTNFAAGVFDELFKTELYFPKLAGVMDLFKLYVLISHFRPRDVTIGNSLFEMPSYARAYVCICNL